MKGARSPVGRKGYRSKQAKRAHNHGSQYSYFQDATARSLMDKACGDVGKVLVPAPTLGYALCPADPHV